MLLYCIRNVCQYFDFKIQELDDTMRTSVRNMSELTVQESYVLL